MMDIDAYQIACMGTAKSDHASRQEQLFNFTLGLVGEAGEFANKLKKELYHGHPTEVKEYIEELGDVLWYVAMLAHTFNRTLSSVAEENIAKLDRRYPAGFDPDRSRNRTD